jgi:ABC-type Fe3+-citrate transport system substrate-binding protein
MTQQGMNIKKKNLQQRLETMKLMMGSKSVNPKEKTTWRNATLWKNIKTSWRSKVVNVDGAIFNN